MEAKNQVKIMIAYHGNNTEMIRHDEILTPIRVGACQNPDAGSYDRHQLRDDIGENISEKNSSYNEMTALYWAWKNYKDLGNPQYIGLMHYRRGFVFNEEVKKTVRIYETYANDYWDSVFYSEENVKRIIQKYDIVCPRPLYRNTVYEHYQKNHRIEDLDVAIDIIHKDYPEYIKAAEKYLNGDQAYFYNMFIMKKELFFKYCEWIFGILSKVEQRIDIKDKRLFISERLTGIFLQYMMDCGYRTGFLSTTFIEGEHVIPILMSTDDRYALQTGVAMSSILQNAKKNTRYHFYIMVPHDFLEQSKELIKRIYKFYARVVIEFIDMKESFSNAKLQTRNHITLPTYYRLMAPSVLLDCKKIIYLDSDVIIRKDLSELYSQYIDDFLVAGVKAPSYHFYSESHKKWYTEKIGIKDLNQYINAGVLLMNLEQMRKLSIVSQFCNLSVNDNPSQDQDVLNICCYGQIKFLPFKYNNMLSKYVGQEKELEKLFEPNEFTMAVNEPVIIHYCDKQKPWNSSECKYGEVWWEYARKSPFYAECLTLGGKQAMEDDTVKCSKLREIGNIRSFMRAKDGCKVSVIVPVFNEEKYLAGCLDSIVSQSLRNIEIICINDGSTDHTLEILSLYEKKDSRIRIINQKNAGAGPSRNEGIKSARGEFVAFIDGDDYYPSSRVLEELYNIALRYNVKVAGGSFCEDHDGTIKYSFREELKPYVFLKPGIISFSDYQFDYGYTRFIYNLEMLRKNHIVFPNYRRFQDPPFFIETMLVAKKFYTVPMPTYCYRWHKDKINWDNEKVRELLRGIIHCLRLSKENRLGKLHWFCVKHINEHYYNKIISVNEKEVFSLLEEAEHMIDRELLKEAGECIEDGKVLKPYAYLLSKKNN